jgi:hypothetical protein
MHERLGNSYLCGDVIREYSAEPEPGRSMKSGDL